MLFIFCSSLNAWMTDPDPKNNKALKNAWVINETWQHCMLQHQQQKTYSPVDCK
jgi:hypothetical protein